MESDIDPAYQKYNLSTLNSTLCSELNINISLIHHNRK